MLYACTIKFDVTKNLEKFLNFELNKALKEIQDLRLGRTTPPGDWAEHNSGSSPTFHHRSRLPPWPPRVAFLSSVRRRRRPARTADSNSVRSSLPLPRFGSWLQPPPHPSPSYRVLSLALPLRLGGLPQPPPYARCRALRRSLRRRRAPTRYPTPFFSLSAVRKRGENGYYRATIVVASLK